MEIIRSSIVTFILLQMSGAEKTCRELYLMVEWISMHTVNFVKNITIWTPQKLRNSTICMLFRGFFISPSIFLLYLSSNLISIRRHHFRIYLDVAPYVYYFSISCGIRPYAHNKTALNIGLQQSYCIAINYSGFNGPSSVLFITFDM